MEAFALIKAGALCPDVLVGMLGQLQGVTRVERVRGPYHIVARILFSGGPAQRSHIEQLCALGQVEFCWLAPQAGLQDGGRTKVSSPSR